MFFAVVRTVGPTTFEKEVLRYFLVFVERSVHSSVLANGPDLAGP